MARWVPVMFAAAVVMLIVGVALLAGDDPREPAADPPLPAVLAEALGRLEDAGYEVDSFYVPEKEVSVLDVVTDEVRVAIWLDRGPGSPTRLPREMHDTLSLDREIPCDGSDIRISQAGDNDAVTREIRDASGLCPKLGFRTYASKEPCPTNVAGGQGGYSLKNFGGPDQGEITHDPEPFGEFFRPNTGWSIGDRCLFTKVTTGLLVRDHQTGAIFVDRRVPWNPKLVERLGGSVRLPGSGSIRITRAPLGFLEALSSGGGLTGEIEFVSESGLRGVLSLSDCSVTLTPPTAVATVTSCAGDAAENEAAALAP